MFDFDNPVVRLCVQAGEAGRAGDLDRQRALLRKAWDTASTPYERAVAAHHVARIQPTPQAAHHWNRDALDAAREVEPSAVRGLLPPLLLAFAQSLGRVGNLGRAASTYRELIEAARGVDGEAEYVRAAEEGLGRLGVEGSG